MPVDVAAAVAAIDELIEAIDSTTAEIALAGATQVQEDARQYAPKLSGALAASIVVEGPTNRGRRYGMKSVPAGPNFWTAMVGPTVPYGRIRELGGHIPGWKNGKERNMGHPYLKWYWQGKPVFKKRVRQYGTGYLESAVEKLTADYRDMAARRWSVPIKSI